MNEDKLISKWEDFLSGKTFNLFYGQINTISLPEVKKIVEGGLDAYEKYENDLFFMNADLISERFKEELKDFENEFHIDVNQNQVDTLLSIFEEHVDINIEYIIPSCDIFLVDDLRSIHLVIGDGPGKEEDLITLRKIFTRLLIRKYVDDFLEMARGEYDIDEGYLFFGTIINARKLFRDYYKCRKRYLICPPYIIFEGTNPDETFLFDKLTANIVICLDNVSLYPIDNYLSKVSTQK